MTCYGFPRAFQHHEVRIGWFAARAVQATQIRTQPSRTAGHVTHELAPLEGCGVQSTRNPTPPLPTFPSPRTPIVRGPESESFTWVYSRALSHQGWVPTVDIEIDPTACDKPPLRGPGLLDFHAWRTQPGLKNPSGCGKLSQTQPLRRVSARETYLRYSARGTSFHYLHNGDIIRLHIVDGPHGFAFATVFSTQDPTNSSVRKGTQGWVLQQSLTSNL